MWERGGIDNVTLMIIYDCMVWFWIFDIYHWHKELHVSNIGFATPTLFYKIPLPFSHANLYFSKLSKENWILFLFFSFLFQSLLFPNLFLPFLHKNLCFHSNVWSLSIFHATTTHTFLFNFFYFTILSLFYHFISDSNESKKLVFKRS